MTKQAKASEFYAVVEQAETERQNAQRQVNEGLIAAATGYLKAARDAAQSGDPSVRRQMLAELIRLESEDFRRTKSSNPERDRVLDRILSKQVTQTNFDKFYGRR